MADPISFRELMQQVAKAQQLMEEAHAGAPPSREKDLLAQVIQTMQKSRAEAEEAYPRAVEELQRSVAEGQSTVAKAEQERAEMSARLQEAVAQARQKQAEATTPRPAPPPPPPEPGLGQQLRSELLDRLDEGKPVRPEQGPREIWEDWS